MSRTKHARPPRRRVRPRDIPIRCFYNNWRGFAATVAIAGGTKCATHGVGKLVTETDTWGDVRETLVCPMCEQETARYNRNCKRKGWRL